MPRPTLPPFEHHVIQVPDVRIHYAELDVPGRPMLLLHGIGMDWRVWQAISRRLAPHFHLYLMDMRGHGRSDKPEHGYSLPHYAGDGVAVIDRLGPQEALPAGTPPGGSGAASSNGSASLTSPP